MEEEKTGKVFVAKMEREDWRWTRRGVSGHAVEESVLMFGPGLTLRMATLQCQKRDELRKHVWQRARRPLYRLRLSYLNQSWSDFSHVKEGQPRDPGWWAYGLVDSCPTSEHVLQPRIESVTWTDRMSKVQPPEEEEEESTV